ncbi:hypothetical protein VPH35_077992 [Triticum aestivum]
MGCAFLSSSSPRKREQRAQGYEESAVLAAETSFTVNKVEALYELYKKLSFSIFKDGLIHKQEFRLALFRTSKGANLFVDRVFDLFDLKRNRVIEFGEFMRSLSIFHPKAPESKNTAFAFKLYDLRGTGYIKKEELREMVSVLCLSDNTVEEIINDVCNQQDIFSHCELFWCFPSNMLCSLLLYSFWTFRRSVKKTQMEEEGHHRGRE